MTSANCQIIIETARLQIVPFCEAHLTPQYVAWLNDPVVVRYSEQRHYCHTLESCCAYRQSFAGTPHRFWAIIADDSDIPDSRHIGNINAYIDPLNGVADVGILIGQRGAWGQGYGIEAWTAICRHLLCECGLRKITAGTLSVNTPMLRLMARAGMREDGRRIRQYLFEGQEVDIVYTALFRETFSIEAANDRGIAVSVKGGTK